MQLGLLTLLGLVPSVLAHPGENASEVEECPSFNNEFLNMGCPPTTKPQATEEEQLEAITGFATTLFVTQNATKAFNTWVARDMINHAPDASGDGRAAALALIGPRIESGSSDIHIQHIFTGQDYASTFFKATSATLGTGAIMELFRLSGTCLVEHWVVDMPVDYSKTQNKKAFF